MPGPRISVVVPFHDNEDLLADCLTSIAAQSVRDLEVIMVDDGSVDGSAAIAAAQAVGCLGCHLVYQRHVNAVPARTGGDLAEGPGPAAGQDVDDGQERGARCQEQAAVQGGQPQSHGEAWGGSRGQTGQLDGKTVLLPSTG
jgi:cellulose synthase/poly-beta-1,6-N-acetylglucosamine synthase-like glycosyltransferase